MTLVVQYRLQCMQNFVNLERLHGQDDHIGIANGLQVIITNKYFFFFEIKDRCYISFGYHDMTG